MSPARAAPGPAPRHMPRAAPRPSPRLVIVSNRVPNPRERAATAGGLAVTLREAIAGREALWFGWSGETAAATATEARVARHGMLTLATIDLGAEDYRHYYQGFANAHALADAALPPRPRAVLARGLRAATGG